MLRSGDEIGPYTLINKLGKGAFGVVWLAERRTQITTTTAAIKIPLDEEISIESIKNEADLWVRASGHSNVLPIIEANIYDEQIIIASEYAPDGSLEAYLKKHGKAPTIESAVEIVAGILSGLEHLHSRSIIHRDLKPANILFQGNTPRLADFGISRVLKSTSQSSNIMGTPSYMAPEAFDGKRNEQTDIWSVGVIFYQLLAGHLPYREEDITSLVGAILMRNPEPLPANIPKPIQNVVARALAKDTSLRYKSAAEMRAALRNPHETDPNFQADKSVFTRQSPVNTMPPQPVHAPPEKRSNAPHFIYAIAGLLAVVIIVIILAFLFKTPANSDSTSANKMTNGNSFSTSTEISNTSVKQPTPRQPLKKSVTLQADKMWMDTGINVKRGDTVTITASGRWSNSKGQPTLFIGPNGMGNSWKGIILESSTIGSLIGKVGSNIFPIGENCSVNSSDTGNLYLSMNDVPMYFDDNVGSLSVNITVSE